MPIYEYQCQNCGYHFEEFQSMTEESLVKCPNCGENELKRLIGAGSGIIFKGSGFYITDYKKKNSSESKITHSKTEKKEHRKPDEHKQKEIKPKETKKEKKSDKK